MPMHGREALRPPRAALGEPLNGIGRVHGSRPPAMHENVSVTGCRVTPRHAPSRPEGGELLTPYPFAA